MRMRILFLTGITALFLTTSAYTLYQIKVARDVEKFAEDFCHYVIQCDESKRGN
jgi:hypothetical protein